MSIVLIYVNKNYNTSTIKQVQKRLNASFKIFLCRHEGCVRIRASSCPTAADAAAYARPTCRGHRQRVQVSPLSTTSAPRVARNALCIKVQCSSDCRGHGLRTLHGRGRGPLQPRGGPECVLYFRDIAHVEVNSQSLTEFPKAVLYQSITGGILLKIFQFDI